MGRIKFENLRLDSEEKFCEKCETWKSFSDFYRDKRNYMALSGKCKDCVNKYNRRHSMTPASRKRRSERYEKNCLENPNFIEDRKSYGRKYYESPRGRAKTMMKGVRDRCKSKGLEFDIDEQFIESKIIEGRCEVTDLHFDLMTKENSRKNPYAPSIDRVDPFKGYTRDNVRIILWQVNLMKGELSDSELLKMCKRVVANAKSLRV